MRQPVTEHAFDTNQPSRLMPQQETWTQHTTHFEIHLAGSFNRDWYLRLFASIRKRCAESGLDRVLIDERQIKDTAADADRIELGQNIFREVGHIRVAMINRPERITCLFENIAVNAGAQVYVHASVKEATGWLLSNRMSILTNLSDRHRVDDDETITPEKTLTTGSNAYTQNSVSNCFRQ